MILCCKIGLLRKLLHFTRNVTEVPLHTRFGLVIPGLFERVRLALYVERKTGCLAISRLAATDRRWLKTQVIPIIFRLNYGYSYCPKIFFTLHPNPPSPSAPCRHLVQISQ